MTLPRRIPPKLTLPRPGAKYDPQILTETMRLIENHVAGLQPVQQRQTVTGANGGNAALISLLTALANLGFITDSTT